MTPTEIRLALKTAGFGPVACIGKVPCLAGWRGLRNAAPEEIAWWPGGNSGVDTSDTPSFDVDIDHPGAAAHVADLARDWFDTRGKIPIRFGRPPRRALLFRTSQPFKKFVQWFKAPDGSSHKIEVLGEGQQVVVHGVHPETGKGYSWHGGLCPWHIKREDLVEITEAEAREFMSHAADVLKEEFGFERIDLPGRAGANGRTNGVGVAADPDEALAALSPADGNINATYVHAIPELLRRGEHPNDVLEQAVNAAMQAAEREGLAWDRAEEVKRVVRTIISQYRNMKILLRDFDPATGAIPACLPGEFHQPWIKALQNGKRPDIGYNAYGFYVRAWAARSDEGGGARASTGAGETTDDGTKRKTRSKSGSFLIRPFVPRDPFTLPPRQWLYGKHYQRKTVSATIAPGGTGKSSLDLTEAIAMATCRNLLGEQPEQRLRVWYHNGEDDRDEIDRRILAVCQHYGIAQEELKDWLYVTSGAEFPLRVAQGYNNLEINEVLIKQMREGVGDLKLDVCSLDPLITLHGVPEGDNGKMYRVVRVFADIGDELDCSFELAHHTRKGPAGGNPYEYTADDMRGASAVRDAVRAARILNHMSETEAEEVSIPAYDRAMYFRVDRAKGNYSRPAKTASWRQFISVELPNEDDVGVIAPWNLPGQGPHTPEKAAADRKAEEVFLQLLDKYLARGLNVSANVGPTYAPAKFASEREVKTARLSKAALKDAMDRLLDSGRIRSEEDPHKRGRRRLVPWQEGGTSR